MITACASNVLIVMNARGPRTAAYAKMARIGKVGFVQDPNERFRLSFVTKLTAAGDGQSNAAG